MAKIYYNMITIGKWSIDNVPMLWLADTQALLDADKAA
ncbi:MULTISPECIES: CD1375 family protein [unclassified Sporosarcina]|nr:MULTISPECIES: CD1375 family protein [unclassified Sporosarcina]